jgi:hypothetical protein
MSALFLKNEDGGRAFQGRDRPLFQRPDWKDKIWFHEYFHGDDGSGLGACHQTGWTGLSAELLEQHANKRSKKGDPLILSACGLARSTFGFAADWRSVGNYAPRRWLVETLNFQRGGFASNSSLLKAIIYQMG